MAGVLKKNAHLTFTYDTSNGAAVTAGKLIEVLSECPPDTLVTIQTAYQKVTISTTWPIPLETKSKEIEDYLKP